MVKNFNDFLRNLTPDKISKIVNEADKSIEVFRNQEDNVTRLGNQVGGISIRITLGLLEEYHKWLHQED
jgi:hypothetical protein